jgi:hypothetical protein
MDFVEFEPVGQRISVLAAAVFAASSYKWLEQFRFTEGPEKGHAIFNPIVALAIVLSLAAVVHTVVDFVLCKLPMRFRGLRRLLSTTASIEGYWFQCLHDMDNPYSVICVEYDSATNLYGYHGTNYRVDLNPNAHFDSVQTSIHASGNVLTFNFTAAVHRWNSSTKTVDTDAARGYGRATFTTETSKGFVLGRGEFFETNPKPNWRTFEMYKISDATIAKALDGRTHAKDDMDYRSLFIHSLLERQERHTAFDRILTERHLSVRKAQEVVPDSTPVQLDSKSPAQHPEAIGDGR